MQDLVAELRLKYDYIVVDASPLLAVADSLTLAPIADKIAMIWGRASHTNFSEALKTLSLIGYSVNGIVLDKVDYKRPASYGYGFGADYTMAKAFELLGNTDDLRRRVAPHLQPQPSVRLTSDEGTIGSLRKPDE
jgi:Mrp family chromosome partitioning ATPase